MSQVQLKFLQALEGLAYSTLGSVAQGQVERRLTAKRKNTTDCTPCAAHARMMATRNMAKRGRII